MNIYSVRLLIFAKKNTFLAKFKQKVEVGGCDGREKSVDNGDGIKGIEDRCGPDYVQFI